MRTRMILIVAGTALALAFAAGCGSSSKSSGGSTATTASGSGLTVSTAAAGGSGATVNVVVSDTKGLGGPMTMTVSPTTVPAGKVTFKVTNKGTIDHEVVLLKLEAGETWNALPITYAGDPPAKVASGGDKVSEANNVGETGDPNLKPGESRTFTSDVALTAGNYALVCNIAKHYGLGMRAPLTVS
jgi:uncharacterized cupredoxin-like copper-binding protein